MSLSASALLLFVGSRALVAAIALVAVALLPSATPCGTSCHLSTNPVLDAATRWDGGWYLGIARDGYGHAEGGQSDLAFFPLYPALMRVLGLAAGGSGDAYIAAGVVISHVALAAAAVALARLVAIDHGPSAGVSSVAMLLLFPTTVIFSAVYAESLFLALAIGSLYLARSGRWAIAGVAAACAALTRPFGFLLTAPLAAEMWTQRRRDPVALAAVALPLISFAGWMAVLWRVTGDPLAFFSAEAGYGREAGVPLGAIADLFDPAKYGNPFLIAGFGLLVVALAIVSWRVLRPSLALYGTIFLLALVSSGTLTSFLRYALALFTVFVTLAVVRAPWVRRVYVPVAGATAMIFTAMFALWYWIG